MLADRWSRPGVGLGQLSQTLPLVAVLALALLIRTPHLTDWPAFTDETIEVLWSLDLARGKHWPWTNADAYIGPWHVYLQAGAFHLLGTSAVTARLLVLVLNVMAVGLTYLLAQRVASVAAGLIAALLVGVAPMWVLINSHVAWSGSTTPTYVLGAILVTQLALAPPADGRRPSGAWLGMAGLLLGLAVQTHPTALVVAPGLMAAVLWGRAGRARLRSPWPWLGVVGALLGYAPMLVYNALIDRGESLVAGQEKEYAWGVTLDPLAYVQRAPGMWWAEAQMAAGVTQNDMPLGWPAGVVAGLTVPVVGMALGGAIALWRRGERLVPLSVLAMLLCLPIITFFGGGLFADRYAAPVIGLVAVLVGAAAAQLGQRWSWSAPTLGLLLSLAPSLALVDYYRTQMRHVSPNRVLLATAAQLAPAGSCMLVVLDRKLNSQKFDGGGTTLRALRLTLSLAGVDWETWNIHPTTMRTVRADSEDRALVAVYTPHAAAEHGTFQLTRVAQAVYERDATDFQVYLYRAKSIPRCS